MLQIGIHDDFCRRRDPAAVKRSTEPFTPEETVRLLKEFGWVGDLRVKDGHVESRNNREASTDRWDKIA